MVSRKSFVELQEDIYTAIYEIARGNIITDKTTYDRAKITIRNAINKVYKEVYPLEEKDIVPGIHDNVNQITLNNLNKKWVEQMNKNDDEYSKKIEEIFNYEEGKNSQNENRILSDKDKAVIYRRSKNRLETKNISDDEKDNREEKKPESKEEVNNIRLFAKPKFVYLFRIENKEIMEDFWSLYNDNDNIDKILITNDKRNNKVYWIYAKIIKKSIYFFDEYLKYEYYDFNRTNSLKMGFIRDQGPMIHETID